MVWDRAMDNEEKYGCHPETPDPQKRGLKIRACFDFNAASRPASCATTSLGFCELIDRAERQGITPDVELFIETRGSFQGETASTT